MKFQCSDYSIHSSICNSRFRGRCDSSIIESENIITSEFRCPRSPWIKKTKTAIPHYINYKKDMTNDQKKKNSNIQEN